MLACRAACPPVGDGRAEGCAQASDAMHGMQGDRVNAPSRVHLPPRGHAGHGPDKRVVKRHSLRSQAFKVGGVHPPRCVRRVDGKEVTAEGVKHDHHRLARTPRRRRCWVAHLVHLISCFSLGWNVSFQAAQCPRNMEPKGFNFARSGRDFARAQRLVSSHLRTRAATR